MRLGLSRLTRSSGTAEQPENYRAGRLPLVTAWKRKRQSVTSTKITDAKIFLLGKDVQQIVVAENPQSRTSEPLSSSSSALGLLQGSVRNPFLNMSTTGVLQTWFAPSFQTPVIPSIFGVCKRYLQTKLHESQRLRGMRTGLWLATQITPLLN